MNGHYLFLIAFFCWPMIGLTQQHPQDTAGQRLITSENRPVADSTLSVSTPKRVGNRVYNTYPMPNAYRSDYAVAMPNGYRGDNCVPMPNAYQETPAGSIIRRVEGAGGEPDSVLMERLDKLKETLGEQNRLKERQP